MLLTHEQYQLKLAETDAEKDQVYALRYRVFNEELGEGIAENASSQRDRDEFDPHCDHLLLSHQEQPIGTYRILPFNKKPGKFYSETEFEMQSVYPLAERLAELGRSCLDPAHRLGPGIPLLWAGLYTYSQARGIEYLVGCTSILKENAGQVSGLYSYFKQEGHVSTEYTVRSLNQHGFDPEAQPSDKGMSPLLRMYLRIGAKVLGPPCWDPIFGCYDFLVMFRITEDVPYMKFLQRFLRK